MGFGIQTSVLYGVFATDKSYFIGVRKLLKKEHIRMLTARICCDRLPQEIIDTIAQALYELDKDAIESAWIKDGDVQANFRRLLGGYPTTWPASVVARAKMVRYSGLSRENRRC